MSHKITKTRNDYQNKQSYDDELDLVLELLEDCKCVEAEIVDEFRKALIELCEAYNEAFPFYFKNGVLDENEFQKLLISLADGTGKGNFNTKLQQVIEKVTQTTKELQNRKLMSWLILDYEMSAKRAATSMGKKPALFKNTILEKHHVKEAVKKPWCKDNKTFLDRVAANSKDMDKKLRAVILRGIKDGWSFEKMSEVFRNITGMAAYKAARLIRTETMAVYSKATKEMFLENGVQYVEIIGDAACGGICLDYVGEAIPLKEAELGDDLPPYHPNCACSFCSYTEFTDDE